MHLLTSFEWDTCARLFHCFNINTYIIFTQENTRPRHRWVIFLKLETIHLMNKNSRTTQSGLQGGEWKHLVKDDCLKWNVM